MSSMANWPQGFMVVQGNRMEDLCTTYVEWLKRYPLGPLEEDLLLAQSNGIAQWLKQTLARDEADGGCGVAAAINTLLPGQFVWQSYCALLPLSLIHISEPTRLRRISYAVFCLKKKKKENKKT